jgi:hypothetical protein
MYIVQASKLTKIFLAAFQQDMIDNPDLIYNDDKFEVIVPRAFGAIKLTHMKPVHVQTLLPKTSTRETELDEIRDLVPWLCEFEETDIYGIVKIDVGDVTTALMSLDLLSDDPKVQAANMKKQAEMQRSMATNMQRAILAAQLAADERVKRTLRITHHNLMKQWESNVAEGKGKIPPSNAEALGAHILMEEIKRSNAGKQKMVADLAHIMNATTGI